MINISGVLISLICLAKTIDDKACRLQCKSALNNLCADKQHPALQDDPCYHEIDRYIYLYIPTIHDKYDENSGKVCYDGCLQAKRQFCSKSIKSNQESYNCKEPNIEETIKSNTCKPTIRNKGFLLFRIEDCKQVWRGK